ncbi:MAG: histidinol phosphatase [Salibacteraceae bacterium]|jgi:protein-tyrosine phosphatase|nr:histidinol phosphatase [Salibacteraceae bacterium]MDP4686586.1 histidinol phosphatase [Salibacteraceae bacterium]MDP4764208.1 histidinol phosphatase [Salibacteraceae bacterium]MDP4843274.1 histidinol phosphatase [Salibacteraceae bacterium]MDP4933892.1 histidinol phosphatase [Salibacteraceae bacterium]
MFGKLAKIFGVKEKLLEPLALGEYLKVDIHSHFIPGIDDGSPDMETTLELLRGIESMGYKKVITTPHVMSDYYRNSSDTIKKGRDDVREAIAKAGIKLEIDCAAEYNLDSEFQPKIKAKDLLTFGDNYVLFELPFISEPPNLSEAIFEMQLAGYKPVLAHPERYAFWHMDFEKYQTMVDKSVLMQLNINSLTGHYSPQVKKIAQKLIANNMISFFGSDCHHAGHINLMHQASRQEVVHQILKDNKLMNQSLL